MVRRRKTLHIVTEVFLRATLKDLRNDERSHFTEDFGRAYILAGERDSLPLKERLPSYVPSRAFLGASVRAAFTQRSRDPILAKQANESSAPFATMRQSLAGPT
jgi:hypothetical protein